jgi:serine/threonine-protein kinase
LDLRSGTLLLHYKLVEKLGEGGMGVVWRATDTTLDRDVAVKILPDVFADDTDRAARFEREAKVLASLNHPNITTVHSVHKVDSVRFLVMELAHGEDLAARLASGRLPIDEVLPIARQIAEALEAAHESGIVHRDLKPANITVTGDGKVELLDFGLAKALDPSASGVISDLSKSPTLVSGHTAAGMILGTAAYMSPEQARGKPVDRRADIWAFGCVVYEMLAGQKAFDGETVTDVLAAVVTRAPDMSALPANTPRRLSALVERCLEKDPRKRLRDAGEARVVIEDVIAKPGADAALDARAAVAPAPAFRRYLPWLVAVAGLAIAGIVGVMPRGKVTPLEATHLNIALPPMDVVDAGFENGMLAITRDGRTVAYCGRRFGISRLYVRRLGSGEAVELAGTEGAHCPFFSPDGEWIAFVSGNKLMKVAVTGGPTFELCVVSADRSGVWLDDGTIVISTHATAPLQRVPSTGGKLQVVSPLDSVNGERTHRWPEVLPGDEWVIFTVGLASSPGDYEGARIDAVSIRTGERRTLFEGASMARYAPPGHLILARDGVLMAAPIDVLAPRLTGEPVPILDGVAREPTSGAVHFAVARNGTLVFVPELQGEDETELVWIDHAGKIEPLAAPPQPYIASRVSPDGQQVLVTIGRTFGAGDVWLFDIARETTTRLTFDGKSLLMYWTPDQSRVVYQTEDRGGMNAIVVRNLGGDSEEKVIHAVKYPIVISGLTPDGQWVFFSPWGSTDSDIFKIPIDGGEPTLVISEEFDQGDGRVSPDGRWIVYESRQAAVVEVFVRPFPSGSSKWQISSGGGFKPLWSPKGDEIYWIAGDEMFAISVEVLGGRLSLGRPRKLFDIPPGRRGDADFLAHDLSPDGSRFLMTRVAHPELSRRRIDVILNWSERIVELAK